MSDVGLWVGDGECCGVLVGVLFVVVGVGLWWCVFGVLSVVWCICVCCRCERVVYCVLCIVYCVLCVLGALCCDVIGCALLVFVLSSWPNG